MAFADLKNHFVFRRIFATHPDILRSLFNDLLERSHHRGHRVPAERAASPGGRSEAVDPGRPLQGSGRDDLRRGDAAPSRPGFIHRVVYNACKAYFGQLRATEGYAKSTDVVAISICDLRARALARRQAERRTPPLVPMSSRWNMTERKSGNHGLLRVQYAFLELPNLPKHWPETPGAALWAWLFVHALELAEVPADLSPGP